MFRTSIPNMITTALWEKSNDKYWQQQMEMDLWIPPNTDNCKTTYYPTAQEVFLKVNTHFLIQDLDIRVQTVFTGVCRSDIDMMNGKFPLLPNTCTDMKA